MKFPARVLLFLVLSSTLLCVQAQYKRVMAAEYFWDTDPGQGLGTAMIARDGSFNQAFEAISQSSAGLATGTHTLNVRAEDSTGRWGALFTTVVHVQGSSTTLRTDNIISAEYFWDTDPGQGNANAMFALNGNFNQAFEAIGQNTVSLPGTGSHTLNVRAKDNAGNWGAVFTTVVYVQGSSTTLRSDNVIAGEYFWDTDPGQGSATPLIALDGNFNQVFEAIGKNAIALPGTGSHTLNVRAKDIAGNWGAVFTTVVTVQGASTSLRADNIASGEYFWDTDPGQGSATPLIAFDGNFNSAFEAIGKNTVALPGTGSHTLNVRAKDIAGNWGAVFTTVVTVQGASTSLRTDNIAAGEYFWDTDPGQGSGTAMFALDGNFNSAFEAIAQSNVGIPAIGLHTLNVRAKNNSGAWGAVFTVVVSVGPNSATLRPDGVVNAEYFFDTDPGQGNGTPMLAQGGGFGSVFQGLKGGSIPSPVNAGYHVLSMRSKDVTGAWGAVFSIVVNIDTTIGAPNVIISGPTTLCANDLAGVSYSVPFVSGNTYSWSITGGTITSGVTTANAVVTWNSAGPYQLIATECVGSACSSDTVSLTVKAVATTTINHTMCQGLSFDGYSASGTYADTFTTANGCDSVRTIHLTVLPVSRTTFTQTICQGQSYLGFTQTGTYIDTFSGSNSCDSIRTLNLTVSGAIQNIVNETLCPGNTYAGHSQTGTYIDTFTVAGGCDSVRTLHLTILPYNAMNLNVSICAGTSYLGHTQAGTYIDTLTSAGSCDTVRTLVLAVLPVIRTTVNESICQGLSYGGHSTNGTFIDTLSSANNCDSIRTLNLIVLPGSRSTINKSICAGTSYAGHNQTGTYTDTLSAANTCDSVVTLNLTVLNAIRDTINRSICLGQSYDGHTASGTYTDTFNAANTCDSIRTLNLTVTNGIQTTVNQSICHGQTFDGYSQTGTYIDTFDAVGGCDSMRTLNLAVLNGVSSIITQSICQGQSYGGHSSSGTFVDTLHASNGCDSIRTLHLTILPASNTTVNKSICQGQSYGGHNATGTYIDTLQGANTCDSIRTLNLIVIPLITTTIDKSICQGQSYGGHTGSGTYIDTFASANNCDSIRTLVLTVSASLTTNITKSICPGQSYDGYSVTGTYVDSFTAVGGCDSVRTLNLTVSNNVATSVNKSICQGQNYGGHNATGTYVDTLTSAGGCDSIRTLNLIVIPSVTTTIDQIICQGQTYDGHSATGTYVDTFAAASTCDSIRTLHLTVDIPVAPSITQHGDSLISSTAATYQWYRDSVMLAGSITQVIEIIQNGNYTVEVTDNAGCSVTSAVMHVNDLGISAISGTEDIYIYPNPASGILNVQIKGLRETDGVMIKLSDAIGQVIIEKAMVNPTSSLTIQLPVQTLAAGVYLLQVQCNGRLVTRRVVVAR